MNAVKKTSLRCAIYTRKSTEHGLELEFNSLHAQREACEAYVKSQAGAGWKPLPTRYDDPAYSGGTLERPAVQQLLEDIKANRIDVVVVYKIDRLTRSLADFAKLVEIFDANAVSFVAITQQFNTTTSMGRLTLNVLLSFAQFERELSSERVRDKVAASKKKGKWMGGNVPLGYRANEKKLVIHSEEAETIRFIFARYLELGTIENLLRDLNGSKIKTKAGALKSSRSHAGDRFSYGALAYLLKNRVYLGEVGHKGTWYDGEHEPILKRDLFNRVQLLLKKNAVDHRQKRTSSGSILIGKVFDDRGNRMSPSFTTKRGVRYRFYISSALLNGKRDEAGSVRRISAPDLERTVINAVRKNSEQKQNLSDQSVIEKYIDRVTVKKNELEIKLSKLSTDGVVEHVVINSARALPRSSKTSIERISIQDFESQSNNNLILAVAKAHVRLSGLLNGDYKSLSAMASDLKIDERSLRANLRLAFLSPHETAAILSGRFRKISNVATLQNSLPLFWPL